MSIATRVSRAPRLVALIALVLVFEALVSVGRAPRLPEIQGKGTLETVLRQDLPRSAV